MSGDFSYTKQIVPRRKELRLNCDYHYVSEGCANHDAWFRRLNSPNPSANSFLVRNAIKVSAAFQATRPSPLYGLSCTKDHLARCPAACLPLTAGISSLCTTHGRPAPTAQLRKIGTLVTAAYRRCLASSRGQCCRPVQGTFSIRLVSVPTWRGVSVFAYLNLRVPDKFKHITSVIDGVLALLLGKDPAP
jgi:hypothetical protein